MKLTMESDYALRIILCLAKEGKRTEAKKIAEDMKITIRFTLKILRKLGQSDIVKSYKGNNGGYELACAPKDISMLQVIEAVEGKITLNRCLGNSFECNRKGEEPCPMSKQFGRINSALRKELAQVDFSTLVQHS